MNKRMWVFNFITQYSMKNCLTDMQTACYNSLGQVLTPEPTSLAQRFKGSYLLEKDGLWQQWGRWGRSKDVNLSSTQETIGWSETGRFFKWKFLFGTGKKKEKNPHKTERSCQQSITLESLKVSLAFCCCCYKSFQQKTLALRCLSHHLTNGALGKVTHVEQIHMQINYSLFYNAWGDKM